VKMLCTTGDLLESTKNSVSSKTQPEWTLTQTKKKATNI
jgi:hypothetical protein